MTLQLIFTMVLFFSILGMLLWAYFENRKLSNNHRENVNSLEKAIAINYGQIDFRKLQLDNYQFMKYNLRESLVVQPKIKL